MNNSARIISIPECASGHCPSACSHLYWECGACSCSGGWGASRELLEEIILKHGDICQEIVRENRAMIIERKLEESSPDFTAGWQAAIDFLALEREKIAQEQKNDPTDLRFLDGVSHAWSALHVSSLELSSTQASSEIQDLVAYLTEEGN